MSKRNLLIGTGLILGLVVCGTMSVTGSDDGQGFNLYSNPLMRFGGPVEKTLQIVPPVHDAIWPPLPIFC